MTTERSSQCPSLLGGEVSAQMRKLRPREDTFLGQPGGQSNARQAGSSWLTPVILATQEAEIRIVVRSQPRKIV
jgi:hypothetical protein